MKTKQFRILIVLMVVAGLLAGCGGGGVSQPVLPDPTPLPPVPPPESFPFVGVWGKAQCTPTDEAAPRYFYVGFRADGSYWREITWQDRAYKLPSGGMYTPRARYLNDSGVWSKHGESGVEAHSLVFNTDTTYTFGFVGSKPYWLYVNFEHYQVTLYKQS